MTHSVISRRAFIKGFAAAGVAGSAGLYPL